LGYLHDKLYSQNRKCAFSHVPGGYNFADIGTKALPAEKHWRVTRALMQNFGVWDDRYIHVAKAFAS